MTGMIWPERVKANSEERLAERAFDIRYSQAKVVDDQVLAFSQAALRAPALVAAAGIAASLAFYSANYSRLDDNPANLLAFNDILFWLFTALFLSMISPGLAYFGQFSYSIWMNEETFHYTRPFIRDTTKGKWARRVGHCFRWLASITVAGAILCVAIGGFSFLRLI